MVPQIHKNHLPLVGGGAVAELGGEGAGEGAPVAAGAQEAVEDEGGGGRRLLRGELDLVEGEGFGLVGGVRVDGGGEEQAPGRPGGGGGEEARAEGGGGRSEGGQLTCTNKFETSFMTLT